MKRVITLSGEVYRNDGVVKSLIEMGFATGVTFFVISYNPASDTYTIVVET